MGTKNMKTTTLEIEKKIIEVQEYFMSKIVKSDYEIMSIGEHTCKIRIDDKFCFDIWIANDFSVNPYYRHESDFKLRDFTEKETLIVREFLKKEVVIRRVREKEETEAIEYERLKSKYENAQQNN